MFNFGFLGKKRGIPNRSACIFFSKGVIDTDSVSLSVDDYDKISATWQSVFFSDPTTPIVFDDFAALWAAVSAVSAFNMDHVLGSYSTGIAIYEEGTDTDTLDHAARILRVAEWYGVEWDINNSTPDVTRIGSARLHRLLPVQSKMYACLLNDDGTENYKLDPADWSKKTDGSLSNRDGSDGQVMIRLPEYWFKFDSDGDIRRWMISAVPVGGFTREMSQYVSAYEASLYRPTNTLSSVANLSTDYRGGDNNASWDAESKTLLGRPATSISRTNFRNYARNRGDGWEIDNYFAQRTLLRFFLIEFATRNSQKAVNAALDSNGFKQGGLGTGVTNINSSLWSTFNSYRPFIPCGFSDSLGTITGDVVYAMPDEYGTLDTFVNRYRGIELPFGHIWKNLDGVNLRIFADSEATPVSEAYIAGDPDLWNDSNYDGFTNIGEIPRANGYMKELLAGGELLPANNVGAGSTTYWCDYFYTSLPGSGQVLRTVRLGGDANDGSTAGLGYSRSSDSPSNAGAPIGSRLCYIPREAG